MVMAGYFGLRAFLFVFCGAGAGPGRTKRGTANTRRLCTSYMHSTKSPSDESELQIVEKSAGNLQ